MSSRHPATTASARDYAKAYAVHYAQRDLPGALRAYDAVIERHPSTPEAEYSRTQMRNIVHLVVPAGELLASNLELVHGCLRRAEQERNADPVA